MLKVAKYQIKNSEEIKKEFEIEKTELRQQIAEHLLQMEERRYAKAY